MFSFSLFAADTTNVAVSKDEDDFYVIYYGIATFGSAAGTDNCITQWMRVDFVDWAINPGMLQIWCFDASGTEDVNGYVQFSSSDSATSFKELATDADLDQIQTTVIWDTIGVSMGKCMYGAKYMRLKLDGQTGNPNGTKVNYYIYFQKPATLKKEKANVGSCL